MLEMFEEQDRGERLWGWSVLAGKVGNEFVELGRAKIYHPKPPHMSLKDHLDHHMECGHEGEILIQVGDDHGLDNGQTSGDIERRWDGDKVWRWDAQDLLIGMVGRGEIKIPISGWIRDSNLSNSMDGGDNCWEGHAEI